MNLSDLEKQIATYKRKKHQLEQLNQITEDSLISGIVIKSGSSLQNIFLDNPEILKDHKEKIIFDILEAISEWREELKIDVSDFENRIAEVE